MTVLKNVELHWVKCDPKNPRKPFERLQWEAQIRSSDEDVVAGWKKYGLKVKMLEDKDKKVMKDANGDPIFGALLVRKATYGPDDDQKPAKPVVVVDGELMPLDPNIIGNGSVGNVQLNEYEYNYKGRQGRAIELKAIQVTKLKEFKENTDGGLAFEAVGKTEVLEAGPVEGDPADLWD